MKMFNKTNIFIALIAIFFIAKPFFAQKKVVRQKKEIATVGDMCGICEQEEIGTCEAPYEPTDSDIAEVAVKLCFDGKAPDYAVQNAMTLLSVEREMELPSYMKGMTLAAACRESGFNANAEGDHRFSKDGKTPMAIGILQMWPIYETAYKVKRRSVTSSAEGWLKHIQRQLPSTAKRCKPKSDEDNWRIAWVTGVRAPKSGGRCNEYVNHWFLFKKIQKELDMIKKEHDNGNQSQAQASGAKDPGKRG